MGFKAKEWIEHPAFGVGRVREDRGDRFDIQFTQFGLRTLLKTADLKAASSPSPDFKFPGEKGKSRTPRFRVEPSPRRPSLDFDHLVSVFIGYFPDGFEGQRFHIDERDYKEKAADELRDKLGKESFGGLLRDAQYSEVNGIAKHVLQMTNLVHFIEKAKFQSIILDNPANHEGFANALFDLLHGSAEMEMRFMNFCSVLSGMNVDKWTIATYYQFLATDGKWMFMKRATMNRMADSLGFSLNYKPEPNWLTYSKLQELADRVELELRNRGLNPHSRMDVQGFIWASIRIEEGKANPGKATKSATD
jgi:hypothetical protein